VVHLTAALQANVLLTTAQGDAVHQQAEVRDDRFVAQLEGRDDVLCPGAGFVEGSDAQEADQGTEILQAILDWSASYSPAALSMESTSSLGTASG
jgi:hypothetical protein